MGSDPEAPVAAFARVELDEAGQPLLILENAGSSDVGVYNQILSASVGTSTPNLDFEFQIEVISVKGTNETESSTQTNSTQSNPTQSKTSDQTVLESNFVATSQEKRQEHIIEPEYATCQVKSISQSGLVTIETSVAVITHSNF